MSDIDFERLRPRLSNMDALIAPELVIETIAEDNQIRDLIGTFEMVVTEGHASRLSLIGSINDRTYDPGYDKAKLKNVVVAAGSYLGFISNLSGPKSNSLLAAYGLNVTQIAELVEELDFGSLKDPDLGELLKQSISREDFDKDEQIAFLERIGAESGRRALQDAKVPEVLNPLGLEMVFNDAVEAKRRLGDEFGVYVGFHDLAEFKALNDSFGHAAGDEMIRRSFTEFLTPNGVEYLPDHMQDVVDRIVIIDYEKSQSILEDPENRADPGIIYAVLGRPSGDEGNHILFGKGLDFSAITSINRYFDQQEFVAFDPFVLRHPSGTVVREGTREPITVKRRLRFSEVSLGGRDEPTLYENLQLAETMTVRFKAEKMKEMLAIEWTYNSFGSKITPTPKSVEELYARDMEYEDVIGQLTKRVMDQRGSGRSVYVAMGADLFGLMSDYYKSLDHRFMRDQNGTIIMDPNQDQITEYNHNINELRERVGNVFRLYFNKYFDDIGTSQEAKAMLTDKASKDTSFGALFFESRHATTPLLITQIKNQAKQIKTANL